MQILDITSVYRRGSRIKWTNVEKKNDADSFLREWSPHLRSCHYFALPEEYQTYLFVGVCGGGGGLYVSGRSDMLFCLLR